MSCAAHHYVNFVTEWLGNWATKWLGNFALVWKFIKLKVESYYEDSKPSVFGVFGGCKNIVKVLLVESS